VFVLRCTRKLYQRIEPWAAPEREPPTPSTTRLGDWTANVVILRRQHLVLAVSQVTLLPVLLPLAPARTLIARFPEAVGGVLGGLGVDPQKVAHELAALGTCTVTGTNDPRVLGSMNDFVRMLDSHLDGRPLVEVALELAEAPCGPLGMESPRRKTVALFTGPGLRLVKG
jgi:hypothetical protein